MSTLDYLATLDFIQKKYNLDINAPCPIEIPNEGRNDLAMLFADLGYKVGAEIGVETGRYSETLCKANPGLKLYCVDCWEIYSGYRDHLDNNRLDGLYDQAVERLASYDCIIHRMFSMEYAAHVCENSLDFVYIDANHEIPWVLEDIYWWAKKVRPGGIVSGHDYYDCTWTHRPKSHVKFAVECYVNSFRLKPWFLADTSWFWVKREQ